MITRDDIAKELKKHKNKKQHEKHAAIASFLEQKGINKKKKWVNGKFEDIDELKDILSDLPSYPEYK